MSIDDSGNDLNAKRHDTFSHDCPIQCVLLDGKTIDQEAGGNTYRTGPYSVEPSLRFDRNMSLSPEKHQTIDSECQNTINQGKSL